MTWVAVMATAATSLLFRTLLLIRPGGRPLSARADRMVGALAPAVLASVLAADLAGGSGARSVDLAYLGGSVIALVVVRRSGTLHHAAVAGMGVVWMGALLGR